MRPGESTPAMRCADPPALRIGPLQLVVLNQAGPFIPPPAHPVLALALTPCQVRQGIHAVDLDPGEWTVGAPDKPLRFGAPIRLVLLPPQWPADPGTKLLRFSADQALNRVTFSLFRALFEEAEGLTPACGEELARALLHVLDRTVAEAIPETGPRRGLSARARDFIEWHIRDPNLAPGTIAQALHCSPRNIHRAFAGSGETVGQYVLRRRLERCLADLSLPGGARRPVAEIAFSWGFNNAAHFSRAFKKQFGRPPRACRALSASSTAGGDWIGGEENAI